jgi:hypothetical protein
MNSALKAFIFFSVHEVLFHEVARRLAADGVAEFTGFVWSTPQARYLADRGVPYSDLMVWTRDLKPQVDDGRTPDLAWLAKRERELGVSIERMLLSERHLVAGKTYEQIMRMAEVALREIAAALDRTKPDFIFSEDVSCFHSYVHFVLARERGIKFWAIGNGRLVNRLCVFSRAPQMAEQLDERFHELLGNGMSTAQRQLAERYLATFLDRPVRPTGMATRAKRPKLELVDAARLLAISQRWLGDRADPTIVPPWRAMQQRFVRMARVVEAQRRRIFERPVSGERYVLYPIHYQPEASTLVQAPMYLDQLNLVRDIAASLPVDHRLYVKEHVTNRGRRDIAFYQALRAIPSVRLLGPDEDTWQLIRDASAIAVITGTVGWEGVMFGRPVITFGEVFINHHPSVLRGKEHPKDRWYELFARATAGHPIDRDATLALIVAIHETSRPGFIVNPDTFPEVLDPTNVNNIADALEEAVGI